MAKIEHDFSENATLVQYYNVHQPVGKNCPNLMNDVKLVQYLLKIFYDTFPPNTRPKGIMKMPPDGICGPITLHWIYKFQWDCNKQHPDKVMMDNVMDPIRQGQNWKGSISGTYYTLYLLNYNAQKRNPKGYFRAMYVVPMDGGLYEGEGMQQAALEPFEIAMDSSLINPRPFV
jgi:hypothetical protein